MDRTKGLGVLVQFSYALAGGTLTRPASVVQFNRRALTVQMPSAILDGMTLKVDKAGRIILPKPIRDRLQLRAGSDLELQEIPGGVVLKPVEQRPSLVRRNGLLVHQGKAPRGFDWAEMVDAVREDRLKDATGL